MLLQWIQQTLLTAMALLPGDSVDYLSQVRHVLQERCFACHGALKQEAGLRVDTADLMQKGGDSGTALTPGDPSASLLLQRISASDLAERMPPEGEPLKPEQIAAIRDWIQQGAKAPRDEQPEDDPRNHWAFRTPVRPVVPTVTETSWVLNPIDAFIAKSREQQGLMVQPPADKLTWLRRVSLDLIGLPPTRDEQAAFLADESPEAWERVVDRLLASPQYGERWGRHWMDIWRYSDWWGLGAEVRNSQKHIWHWRDWIVESLNADTPYDQMLREMLAADELYPNDLKRLRASGFLARQYFKFNRTSWLDETVEHTSKAMLGLTVNCSKCHDHKYDPLLQDEYYQLRAFFEPYQVRTDAIAGELDFEKNGIPRAFDCNADVQTFVHIRGDDRNPDKSRVMTPAVPAFLSLGELSITPVTLPVESVQPGLRQHVVETALQQAEERISKAKQQLESARETLKQARSRTPNSDPAASTDSLRESSEPAVLVSDDFAERKADVWDFRAGQWDYIDEKLVQSQQGSNRAVARLKTAIPTDFQATVKYIPRGGERWKSVGLAFDIADNGDEVMIYLSSYADGPKAQVSYLQDGKQQYPAAGAQAREIKLDEVHELTIRVRGTLVNVIVDGQQSVAFQLPFARKAGPLEMVAFDARAEFLSFSLTSLPESMTLVEAENGKGDSNVVTVEQAKLSVTISEKELEAASLEPDSIRARTAAERARIEQPSEPGTKELIAQAARSERQIEWLQADVAALKAELAVLQATPEKRAEAEKKLADARSAADKAKEALAAPGERFTPLTGALKTLENNLETEESRRKPFPTFSTGRRSALARWITDPRHPLPARVAVNHLWARHFGRGLVSTVFDFGRKGSPPTHPELLDWMAVEFVEHNWSMKHLHRLIVLSNTYRLSTSSAGAADVCLTKDPENRFFWRRNPVRMEAQIVRDSLLSLAHELDLTMGGPSVPVNDDSSRRRSLYYVHSHNEHQKFLSMFDDASVLECYRRAESIVPQQALALENSKLAEDMAVKIASAVHQRSAGDEVAFVREAFLTILSTEPTDNETAACVDALSELRSAAAAAKRSDSDAAARTGLILTLLNHNDFVTVR
jgi:mono/diheme cytochrome c family protein